MAKDSKTREALREAAMTMMFGALDALIALEGPNAEDLAHDMVAWHFEEDDDDEESSLSN